jgi:hypothetical protein
VSQDHERIEELLAGYALLALDGEDAVEADRILSEHVPHCVECRGALADYQTLTGDLALATPPQTPSDLVLPWIRRGMDDVPIRRRRSAGFVALTASVVALVAMAGLSVSLGNRATKAESQRGRALDVLNAIQQPGVNPVALQANSGTPGSGMVEVSGPDLERMYIAGDDIPEPAPGNAYQLWLGHGGTFEAVGDPFVPEGGLVILELTIVDPTAYDEVLITEEPLGAAPAQPTPEGGYSWHATLAPAA